MKRQQEMEREYAPIDTKLTNEAAPKKKDSGVEFIMFLPTDSEKYVNAI
jgi:hypothetical protein